MSSVLGLDKDEMTFKFCDNNLVQLKFNIDKGEKVKYLTFDEFAKAIIGSMNAAEKEEGEEPYTISDIMPNDSNIHVIQTKEKTGKKIIVLKRDASPFNIKYYDTEFKRVGLPTLLFGIVIVANKIRSVSVMATTDKFISNDTILYRYPFSNVNKHDGYICFGSNRLAQYEVDTLLKTKNIPNMFLAMPNNDDGYSGKNGSNNSQLAQRELLTELQEKEFNKDWLVKSSFHYEGWFKGIN